MADNGRSELTTNVQPEDGCTDIANELLEALMQVKWTDSEWRILLLVFRLSYGILLNGSKRKTACFPEWSDAYKAAGIAKQNFYIALFGLIWKKVLIVDWDSKEIFFNKHYEVWRCPVREMDLAKLSQLIGYNLTHSNIPNASLQDDATSLQDDERVIAGLRQGHSTMTKTASRVIAGLRAQGLDSNKIKSPQPRKLRSFKPIINHQYNTVINNTLPQETCQEDTTTILEEEPDPYLHLLEYKPGVVNLGKKEHQDMLVAIKAFPIKQVEVAVKWAKESNGKRGIPATGALRFIYHSLDNYEYWYEKNEKPAPKKLTAKDQAVALGLRVMQIYEALPEMPQTIVQMTALGQYYEKYGDYGQLINLSREQFEAIAQSKGGQ